MTRYTIATTVSGVAFCVVVMKSRANLVSSLETGVVPMTTIQTMLEWQRDWANRENYDGLMDIIREHCGAYGMGIDYAYTMVHKADERVAHGPVRDPIAA